MNKILFDIQRVWFETLFTVKGAKKKTMHRQLSHSQNFLKSPERVLELLDKTNIKAGELVYDIGAGTGTITEVLRRKGCKVIAGEIDRGLFQKLQTRFQNSQTVVRRAKNHQNR